MCRSRPCCRRRGAFRLCCCVAVVLCGAAVRGVAQDPRSEEEAPQNSADSRTSPEGESANEGDREAAEDEESPNQDGEAERDTAPNIEPESSPGVDGALLVPPRVLRSVRPEYPRSARNTGLRPTVVLSVTLNAEGLPEEIMVAESGGELFDRAAEDAVRRWSFEPATRDGVPFSVRVPLSVSFDLPEFDLQTEDASSGAQNEPSAPPRSDADAASEVDVASEVDADPDADEENFGATAEVQLEAMRRDQRATSDFEIERDVLEAAPHQEGADLLSSAPGFYVARPAGGAIAHRIMVRGFDAEHGQDLALDVGGLPINLPSHIHGQGYADLGFVIPEVVSGLRVREGVSDPSQGDFAVAGSASFRLGVARRGTMFRTRYGSFGTFRQLALWAPENAEHETFGAVQVNRTNGFGQNRRGLSGSAIFQLATPRNGGWRFRGVGFLSAARADIGGVVRADDVEAGRVGFYDAYPYPTALGQNAANARVMAGGFATRRFASGANAEFGLFVGADLFRSQQNFTGFLEESRTLEDVAGRGDLIEQRNRTTGLGLRGRYRSANVRPWRWLEARLEVGIEARTDWITQEQNLIDAAVRSQTWDERVAAEVFATDLGFYGDVEFNIAERATLSLGARADVLLYEVEDALGNFVPPGRPMDQFIIGFRRSALGVAAGPRTSFAIEATEGLKFMLSYGEGFRSPQARLLLDGERAPFTKVRSADLGFRAQVGEVLDISVAGYWTRLSDDVAFNAAEGALTRIAATRRLGAVAHIVARPWPWLVAAGSLTYVDAELLERPPGNVEDPNPAFERGQNLPYVAPVVIRLDLGANGKLTDLGGRALSGRVGVGYSYLSPRPLPFGFSAAPVNLVDASAALSWGPVELGLNIFNLLGSEYAAFELFYVSDWTNGGLRSRIPARHLQAGAPRTIMATLGVEL